MFDLVKQIGLDNIGLDEKHREACGLQILENQFFEDGPQAIKDFCNLLLAEAEKGDSYAMFAIYAISLWTRKKHENETSHES